MSIFCRYSSSDLPIFSTFLADFVGVKIEQVTYFLFRDSNVGNISFLFLPKNKYSLIYSAAHISRTFVRTLYSLSEIWANVSKWFPVTISCTYTEISSKFIYQLF